MLATYIDSLINGLIILIKLNTFTREFISLRVFILSVIYLTEMEYFYKNSNCYLSIFSALAIQNRKDEYNSDKLKTEQSVNMLIRNQSLLQSRSNGIY